MKRLYILFLFAAIFTAKDTCAQIPDSVYRYLPWNTTGNYWIYSGYDVPTQTYMDEELFEIIKDTLVNNLNCKKVFYSICPYGGGKGHGPYTILFYTDTVNWTMYMTRSRTFLDRPDSIKNLGPLLNLKKDSAVVDNKLYGTWFDAGGDYSILHSYDTQNKVRNYDLRFYKSDDVGKVIVQQNVGMTYIFGTGEIQVHLIGYKTEYGQGGLTKEQFWGHFVSIVNDDLLAGDDVVLNQNHPNPFSGNSSATISYYLPEASEVQLKVYNTMGQEVASLVHGREAEGHHRIMFNGAGLPAGVYFYELRSGSERLVKQMLIMK